ncbi:hypothetical protein [Pseudomonas sp. NA-150]|uniref:hypothetical protein n=1 Tax=Pseudomonas sp. NA-150 TaxID=3367525 RepID=UPI0037C9411C
MLALPDRPEAGMDIDLENQVWKTATQVYGLTALQHLLEEAIDSFKRPPGLDDRERFYSSNIGALELEVLRRVLGRPRGPTTPSSGDGYVEIRSRLRTHIRRYLQWHLLQSSHASNEMMEDYLSVDLGL